MAANEVLASLRQKSGLSFRKVSQKTGISVFSLYLYEKGYLRIPEKKIPVFASAFNVNEETLKDEEGFPAPIFPQEKKDYFDNKMMKKVFSWPVLLASLLIFLVSLSLVISGLVYQNKSTQGVEAVFSTEYNAINEYVKKNGEDVDENTIEETGVKCVTYSDDKETEAFLVSSFSDASKTLFNAYLPVGNGLYLFAFQENMDTIWFYFADQTSGEMTYQGTGYILNNAFDVGAVVDAEQKDVEQTIFDQQKAFVDTCLPKIEDLYQKWNKMTQLNLKSSLVEILTSQGKGNGALKGMADLSNHLLMLPSVFATAFFFASLLLAWGVYHIKKKKAAEMFLTSTPEAALSEAVDLKGFERKAKRPLKNNWKIFPFLPETVLRLGGIALILTSSILLFKITYPIITNHDFFAILNLIGDIQSFYYLLPYMTAAALLWFFVRLEIMMSEKYNIIPSVLMFFFFGAVYYVGENVLSYYLTQTSDIYYTALFTAFTMFLPGNLFWSLSCFSLIVMFLLTTPDSIKGHKKKVLIWRFLALLPIFYLLFSYLYQVGIKLWNWTEWPSYLSALLFRKQFAVMTFAIFYPISIYFYRLFIIHRYGEDNAYKFFHGNEYYFTKNLIACLWVATIVLANYLGAGSKYGKALDLNKSYMMAIIIPFIFFYHPHIGKRNPFVDNGITFIYLISFSFAYAYIGEFLLFEFHF